MIKSLCNRLAYLVWLVTPVIGVVLNLDKVGEEAVRGVVWLLMFILFGWVLAVGIYCGGYFLQIVVNKLVDIYRTHPLSLSEVQRETIDDTSDLPRLTRRYHRVTRWGIYLGYCLFLGLAFTSETLLFGAFLLIVPVSIFGIIAIKLWTDRLYFTIKPLIIASSNLPFDSFDRLDSSEITDLGYNRSSTRAIQSATNTARIKVEETYVLEYKSKEVLLSNVTIPRLFYKYFSQKRHFVAMTARLPDRGEGVTIVTSKSLANKVGDNQKRVKTESVLFDKEFVTYSSDQIFAREHLKSNVIEDILQLLERVENKKVIVYFEKDIVTIIFEVFENPFEVIPQTTSRGDMSVKPLQKDILKTLEIFDHWWLDRKTAYTDKDRWKL